MNKRKAYSYIRMSTDNQLKGDSLRRQLAASEQYAKINNLELIDSIDGISLNDIGVSAFNGNNTQKGVLAIFLNALEANKIEPNSVLLIESLDRLSRDKLSAALPQFISILNKDIEIITLADNQKYTKDIINTNAGSLFISLAVMVRANEESETKSKRLSAAWSNKRANTDKKILTKTCPAWLKHSEVTGLFEIIPKRGEVVKKIFEMSVQACGYYTIAKFLNETKVPVFGKSKLWHISYIKKIIMNRAAFGEFQPHHYVEGIRNKIGNPVKDYFPSVIDEETFLLAKVSISRRTVKSAGRKGKSFTNLFSGLTYCGHCNSSMMVRNRGGASRSSKYLLCSNQLVNGGCKMTGWNLADLNTVLFKHLKEIDFSVLLNHSENSDESKLEGKYIALKLKLELKQSEIKRATDLILVEDLTTSVRHIFIQKIEELQKEYNKLNDDILVLENQIREKDESRKILTNSDLKTLITQIESHQNDYLFRSKLNQYLIKLIDEIKLYDFQEPFTPWELEETDKSIRLFQSTFKSRSNLTFSEIINHPDFEFFYKTFNRTINIVYKSGIKRHLLFGIDTSIPV